MKEAADRLRVVGPPTLTLQQDQPQPAQPAAKAAAPATP
jgi:hypothetical protein